ncbi:hypothetical protein BVC80_637g3 [Macleaya cordata]|uniref:RNase H type-1 domain-containing protein n=1 Tax=Macleaya cordata TaxID=56857 RepID=A0A200QMZ5_MACCD|nr:hypothetical protein BVC80_637g3 [Macleaya cordata]
MGEKLRRYSKTPITLINSIVRITGYQHKVNHMTYLGAPIYDGRGKVIYFDDLLTKIRNKIVGWKANFLTQGGKLTANHMIANFFWGSFEGKPKRNWVSWDNICTPLVEGGLGVRNLKDMVRSFRLKSLWGVIANSSNWAAFIRGKYHMDITILSGYVPPITATKFWKECDSLISSLMPNSAWKVGQGNISFWHENWSNMGVLADVFAEVEPPAPISLAEAAEANFSIPGMSDAMIAQMRIWYNSRLKSDSDELLWAPSQDGRFTVKSAFSLLSNQASACPLSDTTGNIESIDHLFLSGEIAVFLWDWLSSLVVIHRTNYRDLREFISTWFNVAHRKSQMGKLATLFPMAIMWEIWSERNRRRQDESPSSVAVILYKVLQWVHDINPLLRINNHSPGMLHHILRVCKLSTTSVRRKPPLVLRWSLPPPGFCILNTDGASSSQGAAGGGVIRDDQGILLAAFHSFYGPSSNNLAETRALLHGLLLCQRLGIVKWQKIREATENLNINLRHVYRELNSSADCMASLGLSSRSNCSIMTDFPMHLVGLARLDRLGLPYVIFG